MSCPKLKDPTDFERVLARALFFLLDDDQAVIVKLDGYTLLVGYTSTGNLKIEDVTEKLGDLEEGTRVQLHDSMSDAVTAVALEGGEIRE